MKRILVTDTNYRNIITTLVGDPRHDTLLKGIIYDLILLSFNLGVDTCLIRFDLERFPRLILYKIQGDSIDTFNHLYKYAFQQILHLQADLKLKNLWQILGKP